MKTLIDRARELAWEMHVGTSGDGSGGPEMYAHVSQVAGFVEEQGGSEEMIAAAWLHDVVEDTDVDLAQVRELFGGKVAELVDGLTDPEDFEAMPLAERKSAQAERIRELPEDVRKIKLSDQLSNVQRILVRPPEGWTTARQFVYIQGARKIADECRGLWPELDARFDEAYAAAVEKYQKSD